jgi:hypothetical protein
MKVTVAAAVPLSSTPLHYQVPLGGLVLNPPFVLFRSSRSRRHHVRPGMGGRSRARQHHRFEVVCMQAQRRGIRLGHRRRTASIQSTLEDPLGKPWFLVPPPVRVSPRVPVSSRKTSARVPIRCLDGSGPAHIESAQIGSAGPFLVLFFVTSNLFISYRVTV